MERRAACDRSGEDALGEYRLPSETIQRMCYWALGSCASMRQDHTLMAALASVIRMETTAGKGRPPMIRGQWKPRVKLTATARDTALGRHLQTSLHSLTVDMSPSSAINRVP